MRIVVVLAAALLGMSACINDGSPQLSAKPTDVAPEPRTKCEEIYGTAFRSEAERDWFDESCSKWPQVPAPEPQLAQAAAPAQALPPECEQLRGNQYASAEQRAWYLANCGGNAPPLTTGPDRTDCNAIRGTAYRSDIERAWFQQNCPNRPVATVPPPQPPTPPPVVTSRPQPTPVQPTPTQIQPTPSIQQTPAVGG